MNLSSEEGFNIYKQLLEDQRKRKKQSRIFAIIGILIAIILLIIYV